MREQSLIDQRICLISVFYGKLPFWLPAYCLSCGYNQEIDWFFVSDHKPEIEIPQNVTFLEIILEDLNDRIRAVFGNKIGMDCNFPYKLCDFKPFYGMIFEEFITNYDYWGHCDIDIIWGDISSFLRKERFLNYDIFTSRPQKISGHFCLYKNSYDVKQYLYNLPKLVKLLQQNFKYCGIDEKHLSSCLRNDHKNSLMKIAQRLLCRSTRFVPSVYWEKYLATAGYHQREMIKSGKSFRWKNGKTYHIDGTEMMYIHFHKLKNTMSEIDFLLSDNPSEIVINKKGFFAIH
jgi:hypothetical protein